MHPAYVAGLIDGEGHIRFSKTRLHVYPVVYITNTRLDLLEDLRTEFGGDIQPVGGRHQGWKQAYHWRLNNARAVDFLDAVYPHLRIKDGQARLVFLWDAIRPGTNGKRWWGEDERRGLDLLRRQMDWLNRRGAQPERPPEPMRLALAEAA